VGDRADNLRDAAGNHSDLRDAARQFTPFEEFGGQFAKSFGPTIGLSEKLSGSGLIKSLLGLPSLEEQFQQLPFIPEGGPESAAGAAGALSGLAAQLVVPGGAAAKTVQRGSRFVQTQLGEKTLLTAKQGLDKGKAVIQSLVSDLGTTFAKAPKTTISIEAGAGATAGSLGFAAEEKFPNVPGARLVGELTGGASPFIVVSSTKKIAGKLIDMAGDIPGIRLVINEGGKILKQAKGAFSLKGGAKRVQERLERAGGGDISIDRALKEELLPGTTPIQATGSESMLSLERSVIESTDQLKQASALQISEMNQLIRQSVDEVGTGGTVKSTQETLEVAQAHLSNLLETRMQIAGQQTAEKLAKLNPKASPETVNNVAREEINKVLEAGRVQENELFALVPEDAISPTSSVKGKLKEFIASAGKAQQSSVPGIAKRLLLQPKDRGGFGEATSLLELRSLQSKLREIARVSKANKLSY